MKRIAALTIILLLIFFGIPCAADSGFYCEYSPKTEKSSVFFIDIYSTVDTSAAVMELGFDESFAEFREIFEKKLKEFGLWKFAQVLTLLGIKYLGAPKRVWAIEAIERKEVSSEQLESLMNVLSGGNFGFKDMNRYREIKYISDRGERTVSSDGIIKQGFKTLNKKVIEDYKTIGKHRFLLPIGYIAEGGKYIGLLITGRRKSSGTKQMPREAAQRKKVYSSLRLFENNY